MTSPTLNNFDIIFVRSSPKRLSFRKKRTSLQVIVGSSCKPPSITSGKIRKRYKTRYLTTSVESLSWITFEDNILLKRGLRVSSHNTFK
ncbi:hypothetical protein JTE90_023322 [Oedothorax gibbosus]|uniref:Uncharacterized protein n=1 Tax=Oedothorax gibbosus TaxID=931172 RepID=A0AAV6VET8_9ARAC|nr:hypothetical protein JTE90_023322 [Oedothorax gibbosus]